MNIRIRVSGYLVTFIRMCIRIRGASRVGIRMCIRIRRASRAGIRIRILIRGYVNFEILSISSLCIKPWASLGGGGRWDISPELFERWGTEYHLSPPLLE